MRSGNCVDCAVVFEHRGVRGRVASRCPACARKRLRWLQQQWAAQQRTARKQLRLQGVVAAVELDDKERGV